MLSMKGTDDKRLVFLEKLIRFAEESGNDKPQFMKKDMLKRMGICDHEFNKLQRQVGNKCCLMTDSYDDTSVYSVNINQCMGLHNRLVMEAEKRMQRECIEKKVLATLIGTFFALIVIL